jgi:uncharacterized membrane protein
MKRADLKNNAIRPPGRRSGAGYSKLTNAAAKASCVIEVVRQVGVSVTPRDALFRLYGGDSVASEQLLEHIAMERERTLEQDPAFAFRIIVDIASKALSTAINDPTHRRTRP